MYNMFDPRGPLFGFTFIFVVMPAIGAIGVPLSWLWDVLSTVI